MKTLYLVRHAKSSWEHDVIDHERPLKKRGFEDANLVSKHIKEIISLPGCVMSSDAMRAKTTASIFADNLGIDTDSIILNHKLYDFSGNDLIKVIKACDDAVDTLMVFGHNHAMTAVVNAFGSTYVGNVATSGFTAIQFNVNTWQNIEKGETTLMVFPKDLKNQ